MSSDRAPPERPETPPEAGETDPLAPGRHDPLAAITTDPGPRKTDNVSMLVIEAELACLEGKQIGNPAKPRTESVGEAFRERLDEHDEDLVPAWTRPWEVDE